MHQRIPREVLRRVLILAAVGSACGPGQSSSGSGASSNSGSGTTTGANSDGTPACPDGGCESETRAESVETGVAFIPDPTGDTCSLAEQDCPSGEKCNVWGNEDIGLDLVGCFPLAEGPNEIGEFCDWGNDYFDGLDTCAVGAFCHRQGLTESGVCRAFCTSPSTAACASPFNFCEINDDDGALLVCVPYCSPSAGCLLADSGCYPFAAGGGFGCFPAGDRLPGDACDPTQFAECAPGLFCAPGVRVPGCGDDGCCAELCSMRAGAPCSEPSVDCQPDLFADQPCSAGIGGCVSAP